MLARRRHLAYHVVPILVWLLFSLPTIGHAQRPPEPKQGFPTRPQANDWYLDSLHRKLWVYRDNDWQIFPCNNCRRVTFCNGHAIVQSGWRYMLSDLSGIVKVPDASLITCMDNLLIVNSPEKIDYLLNADGDTLSALISNCAIWKDTIQGERVYCFPEFLRGMESFSCAHLKNWGMMDGNGNWLIAPMYDKPFRFESGRARVFLKGKAMLIDELGKEIEVKSGTTPSGSRSTDPPKTEK